MNWDQVLATVVMGIVILGGLFIAGDAILTLIRMLRLRRWRERRSRITVTISFVDNLTPALWPIQRQLETLERILATIRLRKQTTALMAKYAVKLDR